MLFTVRDLKAVIAKMGDDEPVLIPGSDHSYNRASARPAFAELHRGDYYEYFDDANMCDKTSKKVRCLVIE